MIAILPVLALALAAPPEAAPRPAAAPEHSAQPAGPPPSVPAAPLPAERPSLLSGATLGVGGTVLLGEVGFPRFGAAYAQGIGDRDDLGALLDFDWTTTEILAAGTWRRGLRRTASSSLALRARAGLYGDFGATWIRSANRSDVGVELAPGLAFSRNAGSALLSAGADLPVVWTFSRGQGWILAPRGSVALEVPLYGDLSAGARAELGYRVAGAGAPEPGSANGRVLFGLALVIETRLL